MDTHPRQNEQNLKNLETRKSKTYSILKLHVHVHVYFVGLGLDVPLQEVTLGTERIDDILGERNKDDDK